MLKNAKRSFGFYPDREFFSLSGFTLMELIIVVTIISILASVGLIRYSGVAEKARSAEAYAVLSDIAAAESAYYTENNAYTTTWTDLDRYDAEPASDNFTFTLVGATFGKAEKKTGRGSRDYCLNFDGTKITCP